jgi:hypothetical protein
MKQAQNPIGGSPSITVGFQIIAIWMTLILTRVPQEAPSKSATPWRLWGWMGDEMMGIIVEAKEKGQIGHFPLADLEVKPKTDKNYWPVREYGMWFGNR